MKNSLATYLLTHGSRSRELDGFAMAALLLDVDLDFIRAAARGYEERKFRLPAKLITDLYVRAPTRWKLQLATSPLFSRLDPPHFTPLFANAYGLATRPADRWKLALRLDHFLYLNPRCAHQHRDVILNLLRAKGARCVPGLALAGYLNDLGPDDLRLLKAKLSARSSHQRLNASNGFHRLVLRASEIEPHVLEFCTSVELRKKVGALVTDDPDEDVRTSVRHLQRVLRKLARSSA